MIRMLYLISILSWPLVSYADVDLVKVDKSKRRMYLLDGQTVVQEYRIALGKNPQGHKFKEGDQRTPEGRYYLDYISNNSSYYRSVHITYPNHQDTVLAMQSGVDPGGDIKIHGLKNGFQAKPEFIQSFDWTDGCIAITNDQMDDFLSRVKLGTPIVIEW
ncbi:L,D-transpeptidase family protein [Vibrio aestuarianus]|uniref:L,D-transpeptidase family protein n=1 Tax=Vibrio aestuarianus TaxID=28171 RepID=UPI00237C943C|nr:L,D-transpeptidase family protein [Vibrio aestuarianus]MDE1263520.1 L,D-transpeptidase family protein [Vibrio aestuarianus]MDE1295480.1 L,D-transpeptidase family protein [Vibrio aestuarianus]